MLVLLYIDGDVVTKLKKNYNIARASSSAKNYNFVTQCFTMLFSYDYVNNFCRIVLLIKIGVNISKQLTPKFKNFYLLINQLKRK